MIRQLEQNGQTIPFATIMVERDMAYDMWAEAKAAGNEADIAAARSMVVELTRAMHAACTGPATATAPKARRTRRPTYHEYF